MGINQWPEMERPREKLLERGAQALSDAELLAIFLRTGLPGITAVDLSRQLLAAFGGIRGILDANFKQFSAQPGLGLAKYAQLQAVLEMAKRHLAEQLTRGVEFTSPQITRDFLRTAMRHYRHEVFACLYMDSQHRLIHFVPHFFGTIDGASVYPREIVKKALEHNAASVILAHNHPSGVAEPSEADRAVTARIKSAMELIDVRVLDHMIVGDQEVVSLAERGLI